jgi:anti-sigma-K factor RskA
MMAMNHDEAEELLGAYALDALTGDERQRIEEHVRSCDEHREAATELGRTVSLLALTVEDRDPSPSLRRRIIDAVSAAPTQPIAAMPLLRSMPPSTTPESRVSRRPIWLVRPAALAVAAMLVLALAAGVVIGRLTGPNAATIAYTFQGDATRAPGAQARLVYFKDQQAAVVAATGLPRLSSGQVYEMWLIKNGVPVDEGIGSSTDGQLAARMTGDVSQFQQFAITIEPGEQRLPTTTPILLGTLRGGG